MELFCVLTSIFSWLLKDLLCLQGLPGSIISSDGGLFAVFEHDMISSWGPINKFKFLTLYINPNMIIIWSVSGQDELRFALWFGSVAALSGLIHSICCHSVSAVIVLGLGYCFVLSFVLVFSSCVVFLFISCSIM